MGNPEHDGNQAGGHAEHFNLIINGRPKKFDQPRISFEQLVNLALGTPVPNAAYTVTYDRGPKANPEGSIVAGESVEVKSGMVFNVTATNQS